jgi:hypothetical protein
MSTTSTAMTARERSDLAMVVRRRVQAPKDPQRRVAYDWEHAVLVAHLGYSCPILKRNYRDDLLWESFAASRAGELQVRRVALDCLCNLWNRHEPNFAPRCREVPRLRIGFRTYMRLRIKPRRMSAFARVLDHAIYVPLDMLKRSTLIHEAAHLLEWRDHHGPLFCKALLHLWVKEFGVDCAHALAEAERLGVKVAS